MIRTNFLPFPVKHVGFPIKVANCLTVAFYIFSLVYLVICLLFMQMLEYVCNLPWDSLVDLYSLLILVILYGLKTFKN